MRDVLAVEDDRVVLATTVRLCEAEGLRVDVAASVGEALAALDRQRYRLALVDLMLPGRSGLELLETLVSRHPAMPTIMVSGYATTENIIESLRLGAFDFLPKPFDMEELVGVVRRGLRFGERRAGAPRVEPQGGGVRRFLGRHSWASLGADGTATVGADESFLGVLGDVALVELPAAGDHATQGRTLVRLSGAEEVHRVRAPLSGRIVAVNQELSGSVELLDRAPLDAGWLARIVPADPERELISLTSRPAGRDPGTGG